MADYPAMPPFGFAPGQRGHKLPFQSTGPQNAQYAYDESSQSANASAFQQNTLVHGTGFDYNAGFPAFSPAALASGMPPLPIYGGWDVNAHRQNPMWPLQTKTPDSSNAFGAPATGPGHRPFTSQHILMPQEGPAPPTSRARPPAVDEAELSEGEYEEASGAEMPMTARGSRSDNYNEYGRNNGPPSHGTLYHKQNNYGNMALQPSTDKYGRSLDLHRQRDSYSPPSPEHNIEVLKTASQSTESNKTASARNLQKEQASISEALPGNQRQESTSIAQSGKDNSLAILSLQHELDSASGHRIKPVQEARKQAQNAVLNLLPLKVRFGNFVEEGIDEAVIRSIFDDIGMSPSYVSGKQAEQSLNANAFDVQSTQSYTLAPVQSEVALIHPEKTTTAAKTKDSTQHLGKPKPTTINNAPSNINKGEERKDRIARLLEEKNKKLLTAAHPSAPQRSASPAIAISLDTVPPSKDMSTSQSSNKADKEKLLKQKMEALQKSREARAQKATAKLVTTSTVPLASTGLVQHQQPQPPIPASSLSLSKTLLPTDSQNRLTSPQQIPHQTMPSIPGLFLASTPSDSQPIITEHPSIVQNINYRKRPVASDFDSTAIASDTYKRPFGHCRNEQPLVIDVSEDESDDESAEMEIDDQVVDSMGRNTQSSIPSRPGIRDLPPLSDFPPKKIFTSPPSALNTPPIAQAPSRSSARPEDLKRKELEIQEMRRKIAEAELRKKAKQVASGSQTPLGKISTPVEHTLTKEANLSNKIETSVQIERLMDDASRKIEEDQQKLAQAQVLEEQNTAELRKSEAEHKRQRRARIAVDIPAVDAEVLESQRKLVDLRAEMEKLEFAVQQRLEDKRRLAEEMEKLGQEVDDQLQAKKDQLRNLNADISVEPEVNAHASPESVDINQHSGLSDTEATTTNRPDVAMSGFEQSLESPTGQSAGTIPEAITSEHPTVLEPPLFKSQNEPLDSRTRPAGSPSEDLPPSELKDQVLEVRLRDSPVNPNTGNDAANGKEINMTESYIPQPSYPVENQLQTPMDTNTNSSYASTPQDMEESLSHAVGSRESTEMEIDEPCAQPCTLSDESKIDVQDQNVFVPKSPDMESNFADVADGESDNYEPPDATPPSTNEPAAADSPPFSPEPPTPNPDISSTDKEISLSPSPYAVPKSAELPEAALPQISNDEVEVFPRDPNQLTLTLSQNEAGIAPKQESFFTPYESPLKRFRAYRFHPEFSKEVPGGYKSITYTNNIDVDKEFCRFELAGGVCNDKSCEFQHFREIGLPDELILVALGNSSGYREEDKTRFIRGLKEVLQNLRASKIRDFHVIASKICAFRQNFFEDKSKVLLLDGTAV